MADQPTTEIDELARWCPTALAMALERAIASDDRQLEREVLTALARLGIVVVDRQSLAESLAKTRPPQHSRRARS
jgi:hypothetical protein